MEGQDFCFLRQMAQKEEFLNEGMEAAVDTVRFFGDWAFVKPKSGGVYIRGAKY